MRNAMFTFDQNMPSGVDRHDRLETIDEVERQCSLDFLRDLPGAEEAAVEGDEHEAREREWLG